MWTTRVDPECTRPYGVGEVHAVFFLPEGWCGKGPTVGLGLPECELQFVFLINDIPVWQGEKPLTPESANIKHWLRRACEIANKHHACLMLSCDTIEQANDAAKRAARWLPHHERIALERMYHAATRFPSARLS
jgi:hypothetical protein